jgi:hypothetical protein
MTCPVTASFLKVIESEFVRLNKDLYGPAIDLLQELKAQAKHSTPDLAVIRIRAFYCLECIRSIHVIVSDGATWVTGNAPHYAMHEYPRSWDGLTQLLGDIDAYERTLVLDATEMAMAPAKARPVSFQYLSSSSTRTTELLELCKKGARVLRRSLKEDADDLFKLGALLADTMILTNRNSDEKLIAGRNILNTTLTKVPEWRPTKDSRG